MSAPGSVLSVASAKSSGSRRTRKSRKAIQVRHNTCKNIVLLVHVSII